MNVFDEHPFRVILDYAHNAAAFSVLTGLVDKLDVENRKIIAVACPGDRRDEDILEAAEVLAGHYDHYVLKADDNRRGRGNDEVPQIMKKGLMANGVAEDAITIIPDEQEAINAALEMARPKDLLIVIWDNVTRSWKQIIHFGSDELTPATVEPTGPVMATSYQDIIDDSQMLISDERGVRLARDDMEDGD